MIKTIATALWGALSAPNVHEYSVAKANEFLKEFDINGYMDDQSLFGTCPKTHIDNQTLDARFLGKWYEAYRANTENMFIDLGAGDCTTSDYSSKGNGKFKVFNSNQ